MLFPKKVKFRKWHTGRTNAKKLANGVETRGVKLSFGSYGLKAMKYGRLSSNEIEAARKVMARYATKSGKVWVRIFPDRPFTQKPPEVKLGKGKGEPVGFVAVHAAPRQILRCCFLRHRHQCCCCCAWDSRCLEEVLGNVAIGVREVVPHGRMACWGSWEIGRGGKAPSR